MDRGPHDNAVAGSVLARRRGLIHRVGESMQAPGTFRSPSRKR